MSHAQLKAFHAVASEGSVHKASQRLHLTQPAISIHIKKLEQDSGKTLFRRNGHTFSLTEDGHILFEATQRLFRAESDATLVLSSVTRGLTGSLVIGADGPHVVLDLIEQYRLEKPGIRIDLVLANAEATWNNMLQLKVDAAVLAGSPADARVQRKRITSQSLVALVPCNHVLAKKRLLEPGDFVSHPLIFRESGSSTQQKLQQVFIDNQLDIEPVLVLGSREAVIEAVTRGIGIGFVYDREVGKDNRYRGIPVAGCENINVDELVCLKAQYQNPLVGTLFELADSSA